jgi:hypothetical protein
VPDTDEHEIEGDDAGGYAQKDSVDRDAVGGAPDLEEEPGLCLIAFFRTSVGTIHFMLSKF